MTKTLCLIVSLVCFSGCIKLKILPDNAVEKTYQAGVDLYDNARIKSDGGKKRAYSKQVGIAEFTNREEAEAACLASLSKKLLNDSPDRAPVTKSQKIAIVPNTNNEIIECHLEGFIWEKQTN